ncbi:DEAD/DEAH box helicase [Lachnospiraceae bacterium 29-84]
MIDEKTVSRLCGSDSVYSRGWEIWQAGQIKAMQTGPKVKHGVRTVGLHANVKGSGINKYLISGSIKEEDSEVEDIACTCPAFSSYPGICKHCVAVLLNYIQYRDKAAMPVASSAARSALPAKKSSYGLSQLISLYKKSGQTAYRQMALNGSVALIPYLSISYGELYVEFKIGKEKKYVLKNISTFAEAVKSGDFVRYGKDLEFYHTLDAFTEDSRPLVEFLMVEAENKEYEPNSWYYRQKRGGRYIHLKARNVDAFFQAARKLQGMVMELEYAESSLWQVAKEACRPTLTIIGQEDGAALLVEEIFWIQGVNDTYLWQDGIIYQIPTGQVWEIMPFWQYLERFRGEERFVAKTELPAFCQEMLPVLERHYKIEKRQFEAETYLPPKPSYEIYLDAPDKQTVTCKVYAVYGDLKYNVLEKPLATENRDELDELKQKEQVRRWFLEVDPKKKQMYLTKDDDKMYALLTDGMEALPQLGTVFVSDALKSVQVNPAPKVSVGVSLKGELLELSLNSEKMPLSELAEILSSYQKKRKYYRLKNGDFLNMDEDGLAVLSNIQENLSIPAKEWKTGVIRLPKFRALYLDGELKEQNGFYAHKNREFKALVRNMKTVEDNDFEIPKSLDLVLREYQKQGFLWLKTLHANGFGGILADDMGLGKTLQIIAFLLSEWELAEPGEGAGDGGDAGTEDGESHKFALIVCPASLVYNWKSEIERFAPQLSAVAVAGTAAERETAIRAPGTGRILVTSYDLLKRDLDFYKECRFCFEIIDEAQYIKNHNTKAAKAVKEIAASFRVALTGTPIENRLSELWSIFDYLMPGFLFGYTRFREELEIPIVSDQEEGASRRLQAMIRPFVLRRLKKDVLRDLPEKMEKAMLAQMEDEQGKLYAAHVQRMKMMLDNQTEEEFASQKLQILSELTRLRQLCCDPGLVYEEFKGASAKLLMCMDLVKQAIDGGHRILLFSQFTTMLERLQEQMDKEGIPFLCLTGATPKERRAALVEQFQQGQAPVFCISLKAGGTGLNLTAADIVIHYDPWWNVAVQNQATDRAHRIGQKHPVTVYKLIAKDTIEENILKLQEKKSELAEQLLGNCGLEGVKITREEMLKLLGM